MSEQNWTDTSEPYLRPAAEGGADAWAVEAAKQGRRGTQELLYAGEAPAPGKVAAGLGLNEGEAVILRRRLILLDGKPSEITSSYYPASVAGGTPLAEPQKIKGGAVTLLANLGYVTSKAAEDVAAREPSPEEIQLLALDPNEWVLEIFRSVIDESGRPFEITAMTMPARGRTLHYTVEIG